MKKFAIPLILLAVGAMFYAMKSKPTQSGTNHEGMLVYSDQNQWESLFIQNGVGYKISTAEAWSALNQKIGDLLSITKTISDADYKAIQVNGIVSDSGELLTN